MTEQNERFAATRFSSFSTKTRIASTSIKLFALTALIFTFLLADRATLVEAKPIRASKKIAKTTSTPNKQISSRAELFGEEKLPPATPLPVPGAAIALPENWTTNVPATIRLSRNPGGILSVRRVSHSDGRLYLEIRNSEEPLSGTANVEYHGEHFGAQKLDGSVWLSLKPRIGRIRLSVIFPGTNNPVQLIAPTTLVEIRGRQIFLNGEPFLMKGATARNVNESDAAYMHSLGLNTLRGLNAMDACERYGFMNIASLNDGDEVTKASMSLPDAEFQPMFQKCLDWLAESAPARVASPYTLILQVGNESTASIRPPGVRPVTIAQRHAAQMLVTARNFTKALDPMLPVGYANQDLGFLTPDCLDVYMHNSFLPKDRYNYPWQDFLRWQGCLPPNGPEGKGRPFVNSEFGANRYLCQSYLGGPNNPFLEKIHAWNVPCRWAEFMENGTVGGSIYCLHDLETPHDQGCSRFGILTFDRKPKLACWDVGRMWRDFEIALRNQQVQVTYKRDYWARDCHLTLAPLKGQSITRQLDDFAPRSSRTIDLNLNEFTNGFHWTMDFKTHGGLENQAADAWPVRLAENDFLERLKSRDTFPFLKELFDTEVLTADGKPAPRSLAEMQRHDGIIPVALRKRNGVTYLLLVTRENPNTNGPLRNDVTIDVAFKGDVVKVDDMTGEPLKDKIVAESIPGGIRLKNVQAARIPGSIGQRSEKPFMLPIYRISP
jgi:hypothetical protein